MTTTNSLIAYNSKALLKVNGIHGQRNTPASTKPLNVENDSSSISKL